MADNNNAPQNVVPKARVRYAMDPDERKKTFFGRMSHEPWIPLGAVGTAGILASGLYQMGQGNAVKSQLMMRFRVAAQATTVLAVFLSMTSGALFAKNQENKQKQLDLHMARQEYAEAAAAAKAAGRQ